MIIAVAQIKGFLGDFKGSGKKLLLLSHKAKAAGADLLIGPEGALSGFPPKSLIWQKGFLEGQSQEILSLKSRLPYGLSLLIGAFQQEKGRLFNGALLLKKGAKSRFFKKARLCDSDVFQESRYFDKGAMKDNFFHLRKNRAQVLICEDIFHPPDFLSEGRMRPDVILCLNSSPWAPGKREARLKALRRIQKKCPCPVLYANRTGGEGGILYDGNSLILDSKSRLIYEGRFFEEDFQMFSLSPKDIKMLPSSPPLNSQQRPAPAGNPAPAAAAAQRPMRQQTGGAAPKDRPGGPEQRRRSLLEQQEQALIAGMRDFFEESGFQKAHLGLSGGIDSALTACLAAKALGAKNVKALFLPGPFTLKLSFALARKISQNLGISFESHSITPLYRLFLQALKPKRPATKQNLQARIRALMLCALGNEEESLLLSTGNKSELACGYSTMYGDLAGALSPIGDLYKTEVFQMARNINQRQRVFPEKTLSRPPSAELARGQKDEDDLPPYSQLDPLLQSFMRKGRSGRRRCGGGPKAAARQTSGGAASIEGKAAKPSEGLRRALLLKFLSSEFKRAQAPPVLRVSESSFAKEERLFPIIHKCQGLL